MPRTAGLVGVLALTLAAAPAPAAEGAYSVKTVSAPAPKELPEPIAKTLGDQAVQLLDAKGETLAEFWLRKDVPSKATPAKMGCVEDVVDSLIGPAVSGIVIPVVKPRRLLRNVYPDRIIMGEVMLLQAAVSASSS